MQTPKPVLVMIDYDEKAGLSPEGFLPITNVREIEPERFHLPCELEADKDEWKIFTHLRAEGERGGYAQLALKLDLPAPVWDYRITISPEAAGAVQELLCYSGGLNGTCAYFVIPTRWRRKGKRLDALPGASGNITSAGMQFLRIYVSGALCKTVRLCVCPSSFSEEEYRLILQDIALVHRQLLMGQGKTRAASVGGRWETKAPDIEAQTARMKAILRRLESAPERELIAAQSRLPGHKVKKLTPKALADQAAGKRLLRTGTHEESYDIYEHRMIRTYLENLKKLADQYRALERMEQQALARELISEEARAAAQTELAHVVRDLFQTPKRPSAYPLTRLSLRVCGAPRLQKKGSLNYGKLFVPYTSTDGQPILSGGTEHLAYENCLPSQLSIKVMYNGQQTLFFRHCVERLRQRWNDRRASFRVAFICRFSPIYQDRLTKCDIEIQDLDGMEIEGEPPLRPQDIFSGRETQEDWVNHLRTCMDEAIPDGKDELFYHMALIQRAQSQRDIQAGIDENGGRWDNVQRQIDQLLTASPLLRGVGTGERLHTSNLFSKHRNYRLTYGLMRENQAQFTGIDLWDGSSLLVDETNKLYELWCLLKMLSIWISDYSFTLISPTMEALTQQLLRHLHSEDADVEPIVLRMETGTLAGMELQLDYDKRRGKSVLRPDYFLTISYGGKTYRFCMDAKYRNYAPDQMTKTAWYQDMFEVSLDKYISRLQAETGEPIHGSYILHSDSENRGGGQDMGRYFWSRAARTPQSPGAYRLEPAEVERYLRKQSRGKREAEILSRLPQELDDAGDCTFGSICFTPLSDTAPDAAFRGLMQMIMEHFLGNDFPGVDPPKEGFPGLYRAKCWMCGSEALKIKPLRTDSNAWKYHIVCETCKEFWVETHCYRCGRRGHVRKLGKHPHGYYRLDSGSVWNVICPDCQASLKTHGNPQ